MLAIGSGPIGSVAQNRVRTCACTTGTVARNPNISQHLGQNHSVVALAASDYDGQWSAVSVDSVVDLRCQSTT